MTGVIRVLAGRLLGGWVATLAAWLGARYGFQVGPEGVQKATADILGLFLLVWSTLYPVIHRWWDSKHNPEDAAKPALAEASRNAMRKTGT